MNLTADEILELDWDEALKLKLWQIPAADVLILTTGAILGFNGYTPLTALINFAKGGGSEGKAGIRASDIVTGLISPPAAALNIIVRFLLGEGTTNAPKDVQKQQMMNALLGSIESYTITRPGALGAILEGIGSIIPL